MPKSIKMYRVDARIMFFNMVLPLVLFNLKIVSEQRYPKGACPRSIFFPHCFFKRGFIQGVVASLLCKEIMQVNLYFIIIIFSFFHLRHDYCNLLCMTENLWKLNMGYIPIYLSVRSFCVKSIEHDFPIEFNLNFLCPPHHLDLHFSFLQRLVDNTYRKELTKKQG